MEVAALGSVIAPSSLREAARVSSVWDSPSPWITRRWVRKLVDGPARWSQAWRRARVPPTPPCGGHCWPDRPRLGALGLGELIRIEAEILHHERDVELRMGARAMIALALFSIVSFHCRARRWSPRRRSWRCAGRTGRGAASSRQQDRRNPRAPPRRGRGTEPFDGAQMDRLQAAQERSKSSPMWSAWMRSPSSS